MTQRIGLIAEDRSDVEVIEELTRKILSKKVLYTPAVGKGCGKIKSKTPAWCKMFVSKGCDKVILLHDRDRHDRDSLKADLEDALAHVPQLHKVVVIPCEELEAWLLSDERAIMAALKVSGIKPVHHPESVNSPKEFIEKKVWEASKKTKNYVNAVHNRLIAERLDLRLLRAKCPSFLELEEFLNPKNKSNSSSIPGRKTPTQVNSKAR